MADQFVRMGILPSLAEQSSSVELVVVGPVCIPDEVFVVGLSDFPVENVTAVAEDQRYDELDFDSSVMIRLPWLR